MSPELGEASLRQERTEGTQRKIKIGRRKLTEAKNVLAGVGHGRVTAVEDDPHGRSLRSQGRAVKKEVLKVETVGGVAIWARSVAD